MLRLLHGEFTVVVVAVNMRCGDIVVVGGTTLTDAAGDRVTGVNTVVATVGIRDTEAPGGIMLTDAPGDMQALPPTDMEADAPSYTVRDWNQPVCCCDCCFMRRVPPPVIMAPPPATMVALLPWKVLAPWAQPPNTRSNSSLSMTPS